MNYALKEYAVNVTDILGRRLRLSFLNTYAAEHGIDVRYGRELGVDPKMLAAAADRVQVALDAANADPDESSITFSVSGTIPITAQALVTEPVNLDGTSAPAGAGTVIVDGSGLSGGAALRCQGSSAAGSTLFGLSVGNAPAAGVEVAVASRAWR